MLFGTDGPRRFVLAAAVVAVLGCLLAIVSPYLGASPPGFRGSATATGLVGLVFAARNLQVVREEGGPRLAPGVLTALFGVAFVVAPLLYRDVGFAPTAGVQFAGVLTGSFGAYTAIEAIQSLIPGQ